MPNTNQHGYNVTLGGKNKVIYWLINSLHSILLFKMYNSYCLIAFHLSEIIFLTWAFYIVKLSICTYCL